MLEDGAPMELNSQFVEILELLEQTNSCTFITGKAGTGKSTLLQLFKSTTKKKTVVLAPTGLAALHVKGQTIHSFFGFPPRAIAKKDIKQRSYKKLFRELDTIIIDEISMVRADMLDNIDYFLRINGGDPSLPFGGKQMIFFGDMFQLPPVVSREEMQFFRSRYESPYFFASEVFAETPFEMHELTTVYRQESRRFIRLLDAIRTHRFDMDDLETLNERHTVLPDSAFTGYVTLTARNATVNEINQQQLKRLQVPEISFTGSLTGGFQGKVFPTDIILKLKEGAQVMFVKNDPMKRYVNGTIGQIKTLSEDRIIVTIEKDGQQKDISIQPVQWELLRYKINEENAIQSEVTGTFKQYPIRLAWAMTIHKSQGKTFEKIIIHLGKGAFTHGQTYVALSRCTALDGIVLKQKIRPNDVLIDPRIVEFYEHWFV